MFPCLRELFYKCYSFTTKKRKKKSVLLEQMEIYTQTDLISFHGKNNKNSELQHAFKMGQSALS